MRSRRPLELIHTDICGPIFIDPKSLDEESYILTFIDDYTHFKMVFMLKNKSETFEVFKKYKARVENHFERKINTLRCDRGGEYRNHQFFSYSKDEGIHMQFTSEYSPQQNGVAERAN